MNMYTYKINWYNEEDVEEITGLVFAENYTEVNDILSTYYGEDNLESVSVERYVMSSDYHPIIECTQDTIDTLLRDVDFNA